MNYFEAVKIISRLGLSDPIVLDQNGDLGKVIHACDVIREACLEILQK